MKALLLIFLAGFTISANPDGAILDLYDHSFHEKSVFKQNNIECKYCHNFELNKNNKGILKPEIGKSTFVKPIQALCHSCHRNPETHTKAPQTCYTCHRTTDNMKSIKPQNHNSGDWAHNHSLSARTADNACLTCHTNSQCVKCHVERNSLFQNNHTRNFRYFHSIEARANPQKCDSCHSKNYCMGCHMKGHP
ncbi:MAG: cytochrome c3 family protein [Bdellovibrionales bacterium]